MVDWIWQRNKASPNTSTQWRDLTLAFPMIGNFPAWRVGNGTQVKIGTDAIVGCMEGVFLPEGLVNLLRMKGFCTLNRVANEKVTSIWS